MAYKLISTDIDDTVVAFGGARLAPEVISTFRRLEEKGIYVVPNTGRGFHNLPENIFEGNIRYVICANGSRIYDVRKADAGLHRTSFCSKSTVLRSAEMDAFLAKEILDELKARDIPRACFGEAGIYSDPASYRQLSGGGRHSRFADEMIIKDDLGQYFIEQKMGAQKIICLFTDDYFDKKMLISELMGKFADISITTANAFNLEINHREATKAAGLKALCTHLDISLQEVVVAGDNENDISVLKAGAYRIVPVNGTDSAKQYADAVVKDYTGFGVVRKLQELFL